MNRHGMQALKIYNYEDSKTGQEESIVHFAADKSHIDHVIVPSGKVYGPNSQNFMLQASRIILGQPVENTTKFLLQEGSCRFENVNDFLVRFTKKINFGTPQDWETLLITFLLFFE